MKERVEIPQKKRKQAFHGLLKYQYYTGMGCRIVSLCLSDKIPYFWVKIRPIGEKNDADFSGLGVGMTLKRIGRP